LGQQVTKGDRVQIEPYWLPETNTPLVTLMFMLYRSDTNCQIQPNEYDKEHKTHSTGIQEAT